MSIGILSESGIVTVDETSEGAAVALASACGLPQETATEMLEDLAFERALLKADSTQAFINLLEQCVARGGSEIAHRNVRTALIFAICWLRKAAEEGRL